MRGEHTRPRLRSGVMLSFDPVRDRHVVLFPEGVIVADDTALAILRLCDGATSVAGIARTLSQRFAAVRDAEVTEVIDLFADRRIVEWI